MAVHFKFRSAVAYDSISLDDLHISVRNLKQRIVEHKNLASNRTIDFDLVITDSQTGEEYRDDNALVPRNTSVIIKRVPAIRSKPVLQAFDQPRVASNTTATTIAAAVARPAPPAKTEVETDDFGMDLFATPAPVATAAKAEEDAKIVEMVTKSSLEWQRFDGPAQGPRGGGRGRGRGSGPPAGYVCHRCGQPGHFIQQCPTNGDPNYDIKKVRLPVGIPRTRLRLDQEGSYVLPDGSVAMMQPDDNLFAKEANALLSVKPTTETPSELRCPLCQSTFRDAVMIPCCQYSFCDKCIRQNLIAKGQCPQCGSARFKNDDLLPNIALRQAIEKFMQSQTLATTTGDQGVAVPDGDSAAQNVISLQESKYSADDNVESGKAEEVVVAAESSVGSKVDANPDPHLVVPKESASGSLGLNPEGNEALRDLVDGGKTSAEPFVHKGAADDQIALESEVSKGKKKKKRGRNMNSDGGGADASGKGERSCYQCGEAGHLAKECPENVGAYPPHHGVFPPSGHFPMGPYAPDMFWPGPPVPPFLPVYGDGMYPGPVPPGAYQIPPCVPPYASMPPMHWHPGMMGSEMPLSREDFMKLQEEEHNRRRNEHRGDWSNNRGRSPLRHGRPSDRRNGSVERHSSSHRRSDAEHDSARGYSDRSSKQYKDRDYDADRRYADERHHRDERRDKFVSPAAPPSRSQERDGKRAEQQPSRAPEIARSKTEKPSRSSSEKHLESEMKISDDRKKDESRKRSHRSQEIEDEKVHEDKKPRDDRSHKSREREPEEKIRISQDEKKSSRIDDRGDRPRVDDRGDRPRGDDRGDRSHRDREIEEEKIRRDERSHRERDRERELAEEKLRSSIDERRVDRSRDERSHRDREIDDEKIRSSYDDRKSREDRSHRDRDREIEDEKIRKARDERGSRSSYPSSRDRDHYEDHYSRPSESSRSSRHHHSDDDLSRWRPDHYEDDRYRHNSSSSRHHRR